MIYRGVKSKYGCFISLRKNDETALKMYCQLIDYAIHFLRCAYEYLNICG